MRVWAITSIALVAVALAFSASSPAASIEWDFCNKVPAGTGPYAKGACIPLGGTDNFARSPLIEPEAVPFMLESRPELDRPVLRVWPGRRHVLRGHKRRRTRRCGRRARTHAPAQRLRGPVQRRLDRRLQLARPAVGDDRDGGAAGATGRPSKRAPDRPKTRTESRSAPKQATRSPNSNAALSSCARPGP